MAGAAELQISLLGKDAASAAFKSVQAAAGSLNKTLASAAVAGQKFNLAASGGGYGIATKDLGRYRTAVDQVVASNARARGSAIAVATATGRSASAFRNTGEFGDLAAIALRKGAQAATLFGSAAIGSIGLASRALSGLGGVATAAGTAMGAAFRTGASAITAPVRAVGALQNSMESTARSAAITGGILTAAVTAPIVGGFSKAIAKVIDLETNLNVLQAVTGASAAQMKTASDAAIALGADITLPGVTAATATQAMLELGKAGLSFDNILAATKGTLQLATAGQLAFAEAATITGRALNAFKLPGSAAARVADVLAAAANASSADVRDMAYAFQQGSASAALAGVSIEQFAAAIGLMANAGVVGSDAGTSLKTFFLGLTNRSKRAVEALDVLKISFIDVKGNIKPLPTVINDLNRSLARFPNAQRVKLLKDIFGTDAFRAAAILSEAGTGGFNEMLAAVTKVGAANDIASARTKGLAGAIENLSNAWEALTTKALLPILPVITKIVNLGTDLLTAFGNLSPATKGMVVAFIGVLAAAGPLLLLFGGLAAALSFLLTPFGAIVAALAVFAARQVKAAGGLASFVPGIESLATALGHVLRGNASPSILADELKRTFGIDVAGFLTRWSDGFNQIYPAVLQAWNAFKIFNGFVQDSVIPTLARLAGWVGANIIPALQAFAGFFESTILPKLQDFAGFIGTTVIPNLKTFGQWFMMDGQPLVQLFADVIGLTLLGKLKELGTWLTTDGKAALSEFGAWFKGDGVEGIRSFSGLIETIGSTVNAIVGPAFKTLGDNLGAIFKELGPLAEAFSGLLTALRPVFEFLGAIFAGIAASLPGLIHQLTGFITVLTGAVELIRALFTGLAEASAAFQRGDLAGVGAALKTAWDGAAAAFAKANEGQQKLAVGAAMVQGATAKSTQGQGTVPGGVLFGPAPVPGAGGIPAGPPVQNAFTSMNTFGQQVDELGVKIVDLGRKVDDWNTKLTNAPADMQTVMAWYLSQI